MTKLAKLLWVDLEMTGLDSEQDKIIEVAAIATDWNFTEISTYEAVIQVDEAFMQQRMVGEFWEKYNVARDALISQNASGKVSEAIEEELLQFISTHFDGEKLVILAGNSIHQDRKFIDKEWPQLAEKLHYRMLDVSAWKIVFDGKFKKKFAKPEAHRAMEDIRGSIEELQYYLGKVR